MARVFYVWPDPRDKRAQVKINEGGYFLSGAGVAWKDWSKYPGHGVLPLWIFGSRYCSDVLALFWVILWKKWVLLQAWWKVSSSDLISPRLVYPWASDKFLPQAKGGLFSRKNIGTLYLCTINTQIILVERINWSIISFRRKENIWTHHFKLTLVFAFLFSLTNNSFNLRNSFPQVDYIY